MALLALLLLGTAHAQRRGIVALDNTTFDRIVGSSIPVFVRFDAEYSYGDDDDAWQEVALVVGASKANVLLCDVLIQEPRSRYHDRYDEEGYMGREDDHYGEGEPPADEYGERETAEDDHYGERDAAEDGQYGERELAEDREYGGSDPPSEESELPGHHDDDEDEHTGWRENQDLAHRFDISLETLPQFVFFPAGSTPTDMSQAQLYEGPRGKDDFLNFLHMTANVWVGLPGQEDWLHSAAQRFLSASEHAERMAEIELVESLEGGTRSKSTSSVYYAKVMRKLLSDGAFIEREATRLKKMIDDSSLSQSKREEFSRRANALQSFKKSGGV
ncbi:hypothetical protein AB1Y20_006658 [Prymnesium parvum]|uniref:Endoplasmic reticulum resident protein 29 C-terminal domain-containing protein n=1 Tax=Prymnesium parvum TaxID=97485 RepID=A0AB34IYP8_PRYPA